MTRVLAIDAGLTFGYGAVGGGPVRSGSHRLRGGTGELGITGRHFDELFRQLLLRERPTVVCFASPFIGTIGPKPIFKDGQRIWTPGRGIDPRALRPLMGMIFLVDMICEELRIRCVEVDEPDARRAFLTKVPRKSKDIKAAVMRACDLRGWPNTDNHAADALCVASFVLEKVEPGSAHKLTPLFMGK